MKIRTRNPLPMATRMFTDREEPRASFWKKYESIKNELPKTDNIYVLSYYGIGGIGKSRLLKKLSDEMTERITKPRYVYFDFNIYQESRSVLTVLANKLIEEYKFSFPLFEIGCYLYAKKVGEKVDSLEVKQLTEKSPILNLIMSVMGNIPVVGIAAQVLQVADHGVALIRTHLKQHSRTLAQIEYMEADELYNHLPYLFAEDMTNNLQSANEPLVIFLDTYERIVNELSSLGEPLKCDEWIRGENGLIQNIPGVLWVIAGREKLKWERFDSEWSSALEQHILGSLSSDDSDTFLSSAGIGDKTLREQLYNLTKGTPVYLDLCVDQFIRTIEKGQVPDISAFGNNTFDLIERFARYMDSSQKDLVYMLSCIKNWSDGIIFDIAPKILPNFSLSSYEKAKDFSFIIKSADDVYNIHQTVGEVLLSNCPQILKERTGDTLINHFGERLKSQGPLSHEYALSLGYIVDGALLRYSPRDKLCEFYKTQISDNFMSLLQAGRSYEAKTVFDKIYPVAEHNKSDLFYAVMLRDKSKLLHALGEYKASFSAAEEALALYTALLGENHQDTLLATSTLSDAVVSLGNKDCYEKALELDQQVYNKCREFLGEDHPDTLTAMNKLGFSLGKTGDYVAAYITKRELLKKRRAVSGENHYETIKAMQNFATGLSDFGLYEEALAQRKEILKKSRSVLGEDHRFTLTAYARLGSEYFKLKRYDEALSIYTEAIEKYRTLLGEHHPSTLIIKNHLASTYWHLGEYSKACELQEEVLSIYRETFGDNNSKTKNTIWNLASTLYKLGETEKADALMKEYKNLSKETE